MLKFLKEILKTEVQKIGLFNPIKFILIIGTIWYAFLFIIPMFTNNLNSNTEVEALELEIQKLENKIQKLYEEDGTEAIKMEEEKEKRSSYKENSIKRKEEYYQKTDDEQTKIFNEVLEKNRKRLDEKKKDVNK